MIKLNKSNSSNKISISNRKLYTTFIFLLPDQCRNKNMIDEDMEFYLWNIFIVYLSKLNYNLNRHDITQMIMTNDIFIKL